MITIRGKEVTQETVEKFWDRVNIKSDSECWIWEGGLNSKKPGYTYGLFWIHGGSTLAHRLALSFHQEKLVGSKMEVMHACDNPLCCNPNHLSEGTHKENMQDMYKKNRRECEKGENRYNAKLTNTQVKEARILYNKHKKYNTTYLAKKYGVTRSCMYKIVTHKSYIHVGD